MSVQTAVYRNDLTGEIFAFIGSKVEAHICNIRRSAVTVYHDVVQENVLERLRNVSLVFGCNDKSGTNTVAADIILAVLESC